MKLTEVKQDLFTVDPKYYLAHCISADAAMGAGIAVEFVKRYPQLKLLRYQTNIVGTCELVNPAFNLITKERSWHKPTYMSLELSLVHMKAICEDSNIKRIAMPKIGCGLDRLSWGKVKGIIEDVFRDTDVEILVCSL